MRLVLTCGHANSDFRIAHELLISAGLQPIQAPLSPAPDCAGASDDVVALNLEGSADESASGWAAAHGAGLLDSWSGINPPVGFVLVYSSPHYALAQALQGREASLEDVERVVASWLACNDELLRFYSRHIDRCLLVDVTSVIYAPVRFVEHASQMLELPLSTGRAAQWRHDPGAEQAIAASLSQALVEGHREAATLLLELASQASLDPAEHDVAQADRIRAWRQYANLLTAREQQSQRIEELQARLDKAGRSTVEHSALSAERGALLEQARESAVKEAQTAAQQRLQSASLASENDLLLAQLHQVQEELEALFLRSKTEASTKHAELEGCARALGDQTQLANVRLAEAKAAADKASQLAKLAEDRQVQLQLVTAEREALLEKVKQGVEHEALCAVQLQRQAATSSAETELLRQQSQQSKKGLEEQTQLANVRLAEAKAAADKASQLAKLAEDRQVQLQRATAERDQQAAKSRQLQTQIDALTQEVTALRTQNSQQPDSAQVQEQARELTQENELLLLQLHQVQEELEHYFLQHRDLASRAEADAPLLAFLRQHWADHQPDELVLDLRRAVGGSNWHAIEKDGRWAGPAAVSSLQLPAMRSGLYSIQLDVVDAMAADILLGMELLLNGVAVPTEAVFDGFPALVLGNVAVRADDRPLWDLQLRFPRLMAPRERGEDDERMLAIRLSSVTLTWLEAL